MTIDSGAIAGGPKSPTTVRLDSETAKLLRMLSHDYEGNLSLTMRCLIREAGRAKLQEVRRASGK